MDTTIQTEVQPTPLEAFMHLTRYMYKIAEVYPHPTEVLISIDRVFEYLQGNG